MSLSIKPDIRPMIESDLAAVLVIEQVSYPTPWTRDHFLHEIVAPYSFPFVAECGGFVTGYVCLTVLFEEAQILDIAVDPDLRGRGIALMLMNYSIELAIDKGAELLALEVRSTNKAAIALYEKFGFVRTGCRSNYYEGIDDAILMEKKLQGVFSCSSHP